MTIAPDDESKTKGQRKHLLRALAFALLGTALGLACPLLPVEFQAACKIAARLAHLFAG